MKGQTMVQCIKQIKLKWVENSDSQPWASLCQHEATVTFKCMKKTEQRQHQNHSKHQVLVWWNRVKQKSNSQQWRAFTTIGNIFGAWRSFSWISPVHEIRFLLSTTGEYIKSFFATVIFHIEAVSSTNMYTYKNIFVVDILYIYTYVCNTIIGEQKCNQQHKSRNHDIL